MIENNILKSKSIAFAIRTVNCYKFLEKSIDFLFFYDTMSVLWTAPKYPFA